VPYISTCPLCSEVLRVHISEMALHFYAHEDSITHIRKRQIEGIQKHLTEKHLLPPPEPEGWWPC